MSISADTAFKAKLRKDGGQFSVATPLMATGSSLVGGSSGLAGNFVFSTPVKKARIVKHPDCTSEFTILINSTGVDADNWHEVMDAAERRLTIELDGLNISNLEIWSDTDATIGEDFQVYGWY